MADLIDRRALYEQTAEWEASALHMVKKLMHSEDPDDIKEWKKWSVILQERTAFKHDVADAPSAQPETRWIPCSERLPEHTENDDYYLVTIQCEHHDGWDDYVTGFAEWTKHGWDELSCYIGQIKVVAWMPLPKPYERSEDE